MHFLGSRFVIEQSQRGEKKKNPEMDEKLNKGKQRGWQFSVIVIDDASTFLPALISTSVPIFLLYFQFYISV